MLDVGRTDARSGLFWHERGDGHYTPEMITRLLPTSYAALG
ncbi:hypothetical protein X765_32095 [Mesorhizobium sp. LSHC440B00]|nr:hypothetical protein X765_32095 [Mesorhizobium sp. LSHC440B00]ESX29132.1 hypothetical protein X764_32125 [Mesorhizobium sp. LSHC440A00]